MKVKIVNKSQFPLPAYETLGAAGMDVRATESVPIYPQETKLLKTGLFVGIPQGYEIQVRPRSGLSLKTGLRVANAPGTIDSDYRGEICIIMTNTGDMTAFVSEGDRIAQLVLAPVLQVEWDEVSDVINLGSTERGAGGFGSTGQ